jgi:hypothetical protein
MSRFREGDDDYEYMELDRGRWEHNARRSLKSARGRKALAEIREALLALPEKRLIEGALCTVGVLEKVPDVTQAEIDAKIAEAETQGWWRPGQYYSREEYTRLVREELREERREAEENIEVQGCGVCINGALLWHRLVKQGMTPDEGFAALPVIVTADSGDALEETARIAEKDAGIAHTLAWELAYRNDETYRGKTPEERYEAFLDWISTELGDPEETARAGNLKASELPVDGRTVREP